MFVDLIWKLNITNLLFFSFFFFAIVKSVLRQSYFKRFTLFSHVNTFSMQEVRWSNRPPQKKSWLLVHPDISVKIRKLLGWYQSQVQPSRVNFSIQFLLNYNDLANLANLKNEIYRIQSWYLIQLNFMFYILWSLEHLKKDNIISTL